MNLVFAALFDNSHGRYVLDALIQAEMPPRAVFLGSDRSTLRYRWTSIRRFLRTNGLRETCLRLWSRILDRKDVIPAAAHEKLPGPIMDQALRHGIPVIRFDAFGSEQTRAKLQALDPDYLVLGGAPIIKQDILAIPRHGVVNVHPGKLPDARGMDVVGWSIAENIPLGLTVFFVDEGIDTGPIISFHPVEKALAGTLAEVEHHIQTHAGIALIEALQGLSRGTLIPQPQDPRAGKLYRALPAATKQEVERKLMMLACQ